MKPLVRAACGAVLLAFPVTLLAGGPAIERAKLDRPERIQGILCADYAWRLPDGRLDSCFLAEETSIAGHAFPARSKIHLDAEGRLDFVFLSKTTPIEGHRCRGKGHGFMTGFHRDGTLRLCWLAEPETIQGVPCDRTAVLTEILGGVLGGDHSGVVFHPGGALAGCKLSESWRRAEHAFRRGDRVELDARGEIVAQ